MRISGATTEVVVAMVEIVTTFYSFGQLNSGAAGEAPVLGAAAVLEYALAAIRTHVS